MEVNRLKVLESELELLDKQYKSIESAIDVFEGDDVILSELESELELVGKKWTILRDLIEIVEVEETTELL
jgi:hypothetical protein